MHWWEGLLHGYFPEFGEFGWQSMQFEISYQWGFDTMQEPAQNGNEFFLQDVLVMQEFDVGKVC